MVRWLSKLLLALLRPPVEAVEFVDLNRYLGRWYEIARLPNFFEKADMQNIVAEYTLLPSGAVGVRNSSERANGNTSQVNGVAHVVDETNAKLRVTFAPEPLRLMPFVWGNYWILELDADYQWAIVGEPTRKFLWILSRNPRLSEAEYESVCAKVVEKGYDVAKLISPHQDVDVPGEP